MLRLESYQGSRFAQFLGRGIEFKSPEAQEMRTLAAIHSWHRYSDYYTRLQHKPKNDAEAQDLRAFSRQPLPNSKLIAPSLRRGGGRLKLAVDDVRRGQPMRRSRTKRNGGMEACQ